MNINEVPPVGPPVLKAAHLSMIPEFSGEVEILPRFISTCDDLVAHFYIANDAANFQNKFLMSSILAKIKGNAQLNLSSCILNTWQDLKTALVDTYSDKRDLHTLTIEMCSLKQGTESAFDFHNKIQSLMNLQASYITTHNTQNGPAIKSFLADLGLRTLLRGLDYQIDANPHLSQTGNTTSKGSHSNSTPPRFNSHRYNTSPRNNFQPFFQPRVDQATSSGSFNRHTNQNEPHQDRPNYFNRVPNERAAPSRQFAMRPPNNTQNVWNRSYGRPLPKPTPMSGTTRNTNLNTIEPQESAEQYELPYDSPELEEHYQDLTLFNEVDNGIEGNRQQNLERENFQVDASEPPNY
uniref:Retrotransposon gag domain-containing protein n=1 Tax=Cacopsylla melanoneura TaxID=428564 RepID=A0A8D8Z523_9HEMI